MNSLGTIFKVTSFGESHSAMVGCVVEGVPVGLVLDLDKINLLFLFDIVKVDTFLFLLL